MRTTASLVAALTLTLATPALAVLGGGDSRDPAPSSSPDVRAPDARSARAEAEAIYALAYEEVAKAKDEVAAGKAKQAEKRFKKALERGERAVELAADYHEAWNLVGYAARELGDYTRAIAAYDRCLALAPEYAPAREYLGEAYVATGDLTRAKVQLYWLEKLEQSDLAAGLRTKIAEREKAKESAPAGGGATSAPGGSGR